MGEEIHERIEMYRNNIQRINKVPNVRSYESKDGKGRCYVDRENNPLTPGEALEILSKQSFFRFD